MPASATKAPMIKTINQKRAKSTIWAIAAITKLKKELRNTDFPSTKKPRQKYTKSIIFQSGEVWKIWVFLINIILRLFYSEAKCPLLLEFRKSLGNTINQPHHRHMSACRNLALKLMPHKDR